MDHDPLSFLKINLSIFKPRILLYVVSPNLYTYFIWGFEKFGYCLEFVEKCFLTCVFNQEDGWDSFIACVI